MQVFVIGLGLIGSSVARALKAQRVAHVVGFDQSREFMALALSAGVVDETVSDIPAGCAGADVIWVAVPVRASAACFAALQSAGERLREAQVSVTDVGSVKGSVIAAARRAFGEVPDWFVPGHPIAGAEQSGVLAGRADLFNNRRVILTPLVQTRPGCVSRISTLWQQMGASVDLMSAEQHDQVMAYTSHLPHMLAYALVDTLVRRGARDGGPDPHDVAELLRYAAGGFKDFTRIASSDPVMWRDIALDNGPSLLAAIDAALQSLTDLRAHVARQDAGALERLFARAKSVRDDFVATFDARNEPAPSAVDVAPDAAPPNTLQPSNKR